MKLSINDLKRLGQPLVVVVDSLDLALYQVCVRLNGHEYVVSESNGSIFRRRALSEVRDALQILPVVKMSLRHRSAYDEMIGQPLREGPNTLEVPLALDGYAPLTIN